MRDSLITLLTFCFFLTLGTALLLTAPRLPGLYRVLSAGAGSEGAAAGGTATQPVIRRGTEGGSHNFAGTLRRND